MSRPFRQSNIVIVDPRKILRKEQTELIERFLWEGFSKTQELLGQNLWGTKVEVILRRSNFTFEGGLAGAAQDRDLIEVLIEPDRIDFQNNELKNRLVRLAAHEGMHICEGHTKVRRKLPESLGQSLISEGKAQHFECQVSRSLNLNSEPSSYSVAVNGDEICGLEKRALTSLEGPYNYQSWFHGSQQEPKFPKHGGYSLGYAVVGEWLKASNITAAQSLHVSAKDILTWWQKRYEQGHRLG